MLKASAIGFLLITASVATGLLLRPAEQAQAVGGDSYRSALQQVFPAYPASSLYSIAEQAENNGEQQQAAYFRSKDSVRAIGDFYLSAWEAQGLKPKRAQVDKSTVISVTDRTKRAIYHAMISDLQTERFVLLSRNPLFADSSKKMPMEIQPMSGARRLERTAIGDLGLQSSATVWGVPRPVDDVAAYYKSEMARLGLRLQSQKQEQGVEIFVFAAHRVTVQVLIKSLSKNPVSTMAAVYWVESP